jgi:hypothetical protein
MLVDRAAFVKRAALFSNRYGIIASENSSLIASVIAYSAFSAGFDPSGLKADFFFENL